MRLFLLILITLGAVLPGIGAFPPLDRDESRYVQATRQMVESGNYVDIRFQEDSRYKKPIGIYWLQSAVVNAGGKGQQASIWQYRLVSVLAIVIAAISIFLAGNAMSGPGAGWIAALALTIMLGIALEGRIAKTDAMLLAISVLAQGALMRIHAAARRNEDFWQGHVWIFWAAQGAALLLKGPVLPMLSLLTVAALWLFERDAGWLRLLKPGRGLLLAVLIALPWLAAITWVSGGAFWAESLGKDMFSKVASGQESHGASPGYYVLTYMLYTWPLGPVLLAAALALLGRMRKDSFLLFLFAWYVPFWLLCELIPTKLPHYMLPAYPALALGLGHVIITGWPAKLRWHKWLAGFAGAGHLLVTLVLIAIAIGAPAYLGAGISAPGIAAALAVTATGWLGWRHAGNARGLAATTLAAVLSYGLLFAAVLPSLERMWLSQQIAEALERARPCPESVLAAVDYHEPSLVFLAGTRTRLTDLQGVAEHMRNDPACAVAVMPVEMTSQLATLLQEDGIQITTRAEVEGVNYSNGRWLKLALLVTGPDSMGMEQSP